MKKQLYEWILKVENKGGKILESCFEPIFWKLVADQILFLEESQLFFFTSKSIKLSNIFIVRS